MNRREIRELLKKYIITCFHLRIPTNQPFEYEFNNYVVVINTNMEYYYTSRKERKGDYFALRYPMRCVGIIITKIDKRVNSKISEYHHVFTKLIKQKELFNFDLPYTIFNIPIDWNDLIKKFKIYTILKV